MKKYILVSLFLFSLHALANGGEKMITAQDVIAKLDLKPLQDEGGYYRQTFKSDAGDIPAEVFGIKSNTPRAISTAIYYLVTPQSFSALHRIKSDEVFHFYGGDPVEMIQIDANGNIKYITIGADIFNDESPQVVMPKGVWQALRLKAGGAWALMGTTVAPGFEFEDFELGDRESMAGQFPQHRDDIMKFTRGINEKAHE